LHAAWPRVKLDQSAQQYQNNKRHTHQNTHTNLTRVMLWNLITHAQIWESRPPDSRDPLWGWNFGNMKKLKLSSHRNKF
jgi:hypothetical protein